MVLTITLLLFNPARNEDGLIGQFQKLDALLDDSSFDPEIPISILEYDRYSHVFVNYFLMLTWL